MDVRELPSTPTRRCRCVRSHSPTVVYVHEHHIHPLGHGGPDTPANKVWLCPTAHYNIHGMLAYMLKYNGLTPKGRPNQYQLGLARRGYEAIVAAR